MVYDAVSAGTEQKMHCRLLFSTDLHQWQEIDPEGEDFIPLGGHGDFDSHIIFAASGVHRVNGTERVYYLGGNGPHYGVRNSSLGLAMFRTYGLAGIGPAQGVSSPSGSVSAMTRVMRVEGSQLLITADVAAGDSLTVSRRCVGGGGCTHESSEPLRGNVTDSPVQFTTPFHSGQEVVLSLTFATADPGSRVYVFKWVNVTSVQFQ